MSALSLRGLGTVTDDEATVFSALAASGVSARCVRFMRGSGSGLPFAEGEYLVNSVEGVGGLAQVVLGDVLAEHGVELRGRPVSDRGGSGSFGSGNPPRIVSWFGEKSCPRRPQERSPPEI